jgi:hypothetical protein
LERLKNIKNNGISAVNSDTYTKETRGTFLLKLREEEATATEAELEATKKERDNRPNINLTDYQKLKDNQEKHTADQLEKHTPEQLEKHKPEDLKPTDYEQIKADLATAQQATKTAQEAQAKAEQATKDKEQELKTSKEQQIGQESELKNNLFKVSRKLMMLYNEQIKKQTELFYQDLSLDNN